MPVHYLLKFIQPGNNMCERILKYLFLFLLSAYLSLPGAADTSTYETKPFSKEKWEEISSGLDYTETAQKKTEQKEAEQKTDYDLSGFGVIIKYIGFALIIGIIGFICAQIIMSLINKNQNIKKSSVHITHEDELHEENIAEWPLQQILNTYVREGDVRNVVRIYYLMSLQLLHLNGYIKWEKDKTNSKYLMELSAQPFAADFAALTTIYETTWYGKYLPDETVFGVIKSQFDMFNHSFPKPDAR